MKKLFSITAVLLLCACFAVAQTPGTSQTSTTNPAGTDVVVKPMLEFANATSAKIAWTTKQGADLDLHYTTDRNNLQQAAVGAVEKMGGDNHRATLTNLQPNTTYYIAMTNKTGQPVGPVFSFKTPAQGQPPIHEQPLSPTQ
jgi:Purple acid Phosphatase, N-terminal domain